MSDSALFPRDPQPQDLGEFTADLNETRQGFIEVGFPVATAAQWAEIEARFAELQRRGRRGG